jgi:hypothetical protein
MFWEGQPDSLYFFINPKLQGHEFESDARSAGTPLELQEHRPLPAGSLSAASDSDVEQLAGKSGRDYLMKRIIHGRDSHTWCWRTRVQRFFDLWGRENGVANNELAHSVFSKQQLHPIGQAIGRAVLEQSFPDKVL